MPEIQHKHAVVEPEDLEVEDLTDDETEEVDVPEDKPAKTKKAKEAPAKKRGTLPPGWTTPVGLAHKLSELGHGKDGAELPPQQVYSYIKNASAAHPFPNTHGPDEDPTHEHYEKGNTEKGKLNTIKDDIGADRAAFLEADGIAWWETMRGRVAEKRANAAKKATKKEEKPVTAEAEEAEGDFEEVED